MLYTRRQLVVLLTLLAAAGCGLAIGHWRRENPELVERVERLDREPAPAAGVATSETSDHPRAARTGADAEPRRARRSRTTRERPDGPIAAGHASPVPEPAHLDRTTAGSAPCP